ncbi:hypothetical protein TNCV_4879791 [Trichonephila clavipes]|nr:hypothetical protein TNCV_4879791 [Trichonephila clavipes]
MEKIDTFFFEFFLCPTITSTSGEAAKVDQRNEFVAVTRDMLVRVWAKMGYHLDTYRTTKGTHIKSFREIWKRDLELLTRCGMGPEKGK